MTDRQGNGVEQDADRIKVGVMGFAAEMREKGIHVGLGANPVCVTCDEPWPCAASKGG